MVSSSIKRANYSTALKNQVRPRLGLPRLVRMAGTYRFPNSTTASVDNSILAGRHLFVTGIGADHADGLFEGGWIAD